MRVATQAGALSVTVARATDETELVHTVLREFVTDVAWTIPLIVLGTLVIGVLAIRSGAEPIRKISSQAASINPANLSVRLPDNLPSEIHPLIEAINRALDRLEKGFAVQRQFTANAAHELRTALAVIAGARDGIEGDGRLAKLRLDVARMWRLVEQLLRVARLDAIALDVPAVVNSSTIKMEVVGYMAPIAVARGCRWPLKELNEEICVKGNRFAMEDALRNLAENALTHTRPGTEVVIAASLEGAVSVADRGPASPRKIGTIFSRGLGVRGAQENPAQVSGWRLSGRS